MAAGGSLARLREHRGRSLPDLVEEWVVPTEVKGGASPRCRAILLCALLGARAHTRVTAAPGQLESRQNTGATSHDQDLGCRSHRNCSAITPHTEAARSWRCWRSTGGRPGPEPPRHVPAAVLPSDTPAWLTARAEARLRRSRPLLWYHPLLLSLKYQTKELNF